jgi:uncharacterized protein YkwD
MAEGKKAVKEDFIFPQTSRKRNLFPTYSINFKAKSILLIAVLLLSIGGIAFMTYMAIDAFNRQGDTYGVAREAFDVINEYRQANGVAPLIWDDSLEQLALTHSKYMNDTNDFSTGDFGLGNYGQNILQSSGAMFGGGAFPSGDSIVNEWKNSSGDYNLLNSRWKYGAIGVVGDYATYIASEQSSNSQ